MELPADFLSLGRGSVKLVSEHKYTITLDLRRFDTMSSWYHSSFRLQFACFSLVFHSILNKLVFFIMIFLLQPILFCSSLHA